MRYRHARIAACAGALLASGPDATQANACVQAKELPLHAETDEAFDRAKRRVRLPCAD